MEKDIQGYSASEAVLLIRGEKGTEVTLTIKRGDRCINGNQNCSR